MTAAAQAAIQFARMGAKRGRFTPQDETVAPDWQHMKHARHTPTSRTTRAATCALACALLGGGLAAHAQVPTAPGSWVPHGASVQLGESRDGTQMTTLGLQWHSAWHHDWWGGQLRYSTEAQLGHWRADGLRGGTETYTHVALVPLLRNRADGGRSRWFLEGGIGVSLTDNVYRSAHKQFSTRFNFVDVIGLGYSFGAARQHELGLRVVHISNADIKKPNPGMDSVQLQYARVF